MAKIVIEVMPKPVLLDPAGKAVAKSLRDSGTEIFEDVRVGRALQLSVSGEVTEETLETAKKVARELFMNEELEYITSVRTEESN